MSSKVLLKDTRNSAEVLGNQPPWMGPCLRTAELCRPVCTSSSKCKQSSQAQCQQIGQFSTEKFPLFSYFSTKTYVVGTHKKRLNEVLLTSTHNIPFSLRSRHL